MSQRYKNPPVSLADFKARKAEEGALRIKVANRIFVVLPPEMMADDVYLEFVKLEGSPESIVEQARLLMGAEYDEFVAAGGSAMLLLSMVAESGTSKREAQGADPGESGASSPG